MITILATDQYILHGLNKTLLILARIDVLLFLTFRFFEERKGSCNSEAGEFTRKSGAPALRRKGSRRRRHDATQRAEALLLSTEKQNGQAKMLVRFVGGEKGIRTLAPVS